MKYAQGTKGYLQYVRRRFPRTYAGMVKQLQESTKLSGLGLVAPSTDIAATASEERPTSSLARTLTEIAQVAGQVYLTREQVKAQQTILNTNLQRAQQGLPLLDINPAQYGLPAPSVGFGLTGDTTKTLFLLAGIGGAFWLLTSFVGGRRRA